MSAYLPEHVVVKILSKLPPKSLIRFRCVSKTCHAIIGNPDYFSENLLNHSILATEENPNHPLLLVAKKEVLSFLSYETLDTLDCVSQIPLGLKFVTSCKGIICLCNLRTEDVSLWNPSIPSRSVGLKDLPSLTGVFAHVRGVFGIGLGLGFGVGFGFDSRSNDFKVVRIRIIEFPNRTNSRMSYVEVYSLSGGSWRALEIIPKPVLFSFRFQSCPPTVALDGFFIWWLPDHNIAAFDFSDEVLRMTPLPDAPHLHRLSENDDSSSTITLLNGHVALLAFSGSKMNTQRSLEIWVWLEFGVKESWTRLTTVGIPMDLERPLGFWKRGELFMVNSEGELALYDPFAQTTKNLQIIDAINKTFQIVHHMPSSVAFNR